MRFKCHLEVCHGGFSGRHFMPLRTPEAICEGSGVTASVIFGTLRPSVGQVGAELRYFWYDFAALQLTFGSSEVPLQSGKRPRGIYASGNMPPSESK